MKTPHLKSFQKENYLRADQRIKQAAGRAKLNWQGYSCIEARKRLLMQDTVRDTSKFKYPMGYMEVFPNTIH